MGTLPPTTMCVGDYDKDRIAPSNCGGAETTYAGRNASAATASLSAIDASNDRMESARDALNSVFQGFPSLSDRSAPRRISVFGPMLRRGSDGFPCIAPWQYRNGDRRRELWRRLQQKFHRLRERGSDALDLPCETLKARPIQAAITRPSVSPWARPSPLMRRPSFLCRMSSSLCRRLPSFAWRLWGRWRRAPVGRMSQLGSCAPRCGGRPCDGCDRDHESVVRNDRLSGWTLRLVPGPSRNDRTPSGSRRE